ncbi:hypothetical protein APHAL10511_008620 [Amanita phalloides]|nr:hypothetical protein APHAL10511_008620 [Amanita phalloides]
MFLSKKCFEEQRGISTAQAIHAAFANYWDNMDVHGRYSGKYLYEDTTGGMIGCPAHALAVEKVMKAIKTKSRMKGSSATHQHAEAMTIEELTYAIAWSEGQCPSYWLGSRLPELQDTGAARYCIARHGLMHAFMSTGFTLWTRGNELCNLQARDIVWDQQPPYTALYFTMTLENRKGWQQQLGYIGPSDS